jgi:hypothetical protein
MASALSSISSAVSALSARQTFGSRWGRKRGAKLEDKAKAIVCLQSARYYKAVGTDATLGLTKLWRKTLLAAKAVIPS